MFDTAVIDMGVACTSCGPDFEAVTIVASAMAAWSERERVTRAPAWTRTARRARSNPLSSAEYLVVAFGKVIKRKVAGVVGLRFTTCHTPNGHANARHRGAGLVMN